MRRYQFVGCRHRRRLYATQNALQFPFRALRKSIFTWGSPVRMDSAVLSIALHWRGRSENEPPMYAGLPCTRKCCASGVLEKSFRFTLRSPATTRAYSSGLSYIARTSNVPAIFGRVMGPFFNGVKRSSCAPVNMASDDTPPSRSWFIVSG